MKRAWHSDWSWSVRRRLPAKFLLLLLLVAILGFSAVCGSILIEMRRSDEQLARKTSENLASTIDRDIAAGFDLYDQSLRSVATNLLSPDISQASASTRQMLLFNHVLTAKNFGAIQVFDAEGKLILDSSTLNPKPETCAHEKFFVEQRDNIYHGLYISKPMRRQNADAIVLSRRISDEKGDFVGVVAGSIRLNYFRTLLARVQLDPSQNVSLFQRDGTLIIRSPFEAGTVGSTFATVPVVQQLLARSSGWASGNLPMDQSPQMYVWRDATNPIAVLVGTSWTSIRATWEKQARHIGGLVLLLIAFAAAVTLLLAREAGRRAQAEGLLEKLATMDGLTGLHNRRKFDEAIELEWRRAARVRLPLALLMIDADHFKSYNDRFGHLVGDKVLVQIATKIAKAAHRAGDSAARFGGEEFVVLLPNTPANAAFDIAESIRCDVADIQFGELSVSVSIGVASMTPSSDMNWSVLLETADRALYAAKNGGRNQSRLMTFDELPKAA